MVQVEFPNNVDVSSMLGDYLALMEVECRSAFRKLQSRFCPLIFTIFGIICLVFLAWISVRLYSSKSVLSISSCQGFFLSRQHSHPSIANVIPYATQLFFWGSDLSLGFTRFDFKVLNRL
jgi:hypothetical protein